MNDRARRTRQQRITDLEHFVREQAPDAPEAEARLVREMMYTSLRLLDDEIPFADLKLLHTSLRELRHALRVFADPSHDPKVTIFGSARTPPGAPAYEQARRLAAEMSGRGWSIVTGAGPGIMQAGNEGAGPGRSFGLNIQLPFEQEANAFIAGSPKLVSFKYFFTRKLLFVKESAAVCILPGGFGTYDESFEVLTLIQTGKSPVIPVVFVDEPGGDTWTHWRRRVVDHLIEKGMISEEDLSLFRITDRVEEAIEEIENFYRVYHSMRFVGNSLVFRLRRPLSEATMQSIESDFGDLLTGGGFEQRPMLEDEADHETRDLPRLCFAFDRTHHGRLRQLIDRINLEGAP